MPSELLLYILEFDRGYNSFLMSYLYVVICLMSYLYIVICLMGYIYDSPPSTTRCTHSPAACAQGDGGFRHRCLPSSIQARHKKRDHPILNSPRCEGVSACVVCKQMLAAPAHPPRCGFARIRSKIGRGLRAGMRAPTGRYCNGGGCTPRTRRRREPPSCSW